MKPLWDCDRRRYDRTTGLFSTECASGHASRCDRKIKTLHIIEDPKFKQDFRALIQILENTTGKKKRSWHAF